MKRYIGIKLKCTTRLDRKKKVQYHVLIPRDALQGHRRGKNPVAYVFIFIFLPRSRKRQCLILIEV